ncbi:Histone-like bacterial DNA-binding protein, partial [mine drainage metagenome]
RIADAQNVSRAVAKQIVQAFLDEIIASVVAGHRLEFRDFGVFEVRERGPRSGQNPKTHEVVHVPKRRRLRFKVGRTIRQKLEGGLSTGAKPASKTRASS